MSATQPSLTISYTGAPVRVDPQRITKDMYVPNVGHNSLYPVDRPGRAAADLFTLADDEGALVIPDGLTVHCFGDDDDDGGGFILIAYDARDHSSGVTSGWRDAKNLARGREDEREDNDKSVVATALEFIAHEINAALKATNPARPDATSPGRV